MSAVRLAACAFAGLTSLGYIGVAAALWKSLDATGMHRRILNLCYPLSQLGLSLFALVEGGLHALPTLAIAAVGLVNVATLVYDVALLRRIVFAERDWLKAYRALYLEEQLEAQRRHASERNSQAHRAQKVNDAMVEGLKGLRGRLAEGDREGARAWLAQAVDRLAVRETRYCDNPALDALLGAKAARCEELGVEMRVNVTVPDGLEMPNAELCAAFANLIDNALHACERLLAADPGQKPFIEVDAMVAAGYASVRVRNPYDPREQHAPSHGRPPAGRKSFDEEHGWGKSIVEVIASRHDGTFSTQARDGVHTASLTLKV